MALIVIEEFRVGVGAAPEGVSLSLVEHDLPTLQGSSILLNFNADVARSVAENMLEILGPKVETASPQDMAKEVEARGLNSAK